MSLFATVWFAGQSVSFHSEVRGHGSATVVQTPAFPETIRVCPGNVVYMADIANNA